MRAKKKRTGRFGLSNTWTATARWGRLLPFGEAVGVRLEPDGVPLAVHVEEPQEREPRLAEERREPAAPARRRRAAGAAQQRGGTVGEEGEEQGEDDEVG